MKIGSRVCKFIMEKLGLNSIMLTPTNYTSDQVAKAVNSKLTNNFQNKWKSDLLVETKNPGKGLNKLRTYRKFKNIFTREPYLDLIKNPQMRKIFT